MSQIVLKFGGAAASSLEHFDKIAHLIEEVRSEYEKVVVVISAMQGITDQLTDMAKKVSSSPSKRELDMLLSAGERISMSLLAMALEKKGLKAVSFTGSQSGIITCSGHTEALIIDVRPIRIKEHLELGDVVIVAGFQGVSLNKEVTTLGRGGSDTTAVALAASLAQSKGGAEGRKVIFYKDVPGVFDKDPKRHFDAKPYKTLSFDQALALADSGAEVLHKRCVLLAKQNGIELIVRSFKEEGYTQVGEVQFCKKALFENSESGKSTRLI